jgi:hypothetical protein
MLFNLAISLHDNIGLLRCTQTFSSHFILMSTSPHTSERGPTSTRRPAIISRGKTRCDRELVQQPLVRWVEVERAVLNFVSGVGVLTMAGWSFFLGRWPHVFSLLLRLVIGLYCMRGPVC